MPDVRITKLNETYLKISCSEKYMELDIQDRFSFKIANAQHDPRVKRGVWDGIKRLYNRKTHTLYVGLLYELLSLLEERGYTYALADDLKPSVDSLEVSDVESIVSEVIKPHSDGNPIDLYDYQLEAVTQMLNMGRSTCLAATSAGKSLILYTAIRTYQLMDEFDDKKIYLTVPSSGLVEQMYNDFADYSSNDEHWYVGANCQKVSGKYNKFIDKQIVITTWQSMNKLPHHVIDEARAIFIDECHVAKADVLSKLVESAVNCPIRHGLTGTLDDVECNELVIQGLLGPKFRAVTAKEIIEKGRATDVKVDMVILKHSQESRKLFKSITKQLPPQKKYLAEIDFLNQHRGRIDFIQGCPDIYFGNSIILFDRVEDYGQVMYEEMSEKHENTFLITGDVSVDSREDIRACMETHDDAKLYASYGTCQQGMNVKRLHNMILASSSKSKIRVLQSLGRMMRKHKDKDVSRLIDIIDDLSIDGQDNYTFKHSHERLKYYLSEGYDVNFIEVEI